ncbi:hypothetical protein [Candidatus Villigracilis affinis]|uniref:hypothetical protein n=1 Tax=Candidatus Villigracilis affinis TaxID=3140682 RepID=UPI002A1FAB50|nr:hypothetical protein [Anaerolineales bacterium]
MIAVKRQFLSHGVDCGNGKLTLYVDGQQIASVDDTTYPSGGFALFALSGEQANGADVAFDDFIITQLHAEMYELKSCGHQCTGF